MSAKKLLGKKTVIASKAKQSVKPQKIASSSATKVRTPRNDKLSVPVYSLAGVKSGTLELPKEIFGAKVNKPLLAQAIRVYQNNLTAHYSNTKTRSEVKYSTKKQGPQKGSGHARHGSRGAPVYVGGGIATGPKYRKIMLDLPKKMKKAALVAALSDKMAEKEILGVTGLDKATGKTKQMTDFMYQVAGIMYQGEEKKAKKLVSTLLVTAKRMDNVARAARNIPGISVLQVSMLNPYEIVRHRRLILDKDAVKSFTAKETVKEGKQ